MDSFITDKRPPRSTGFQRVPDAFLAQPGLPFASLLSAERIERFFAKHNALFGKHGVYNTAVMLWSFLGQVLRDGKDAACQSAVARVVSYCLLVKEVPPTFDTGDNLIRATIARAAAVHDRQPRQISFTSACQIVLASWMMTSSGSIAHMRNHSLQLLGQIASCEVANRPGRLEPRVIKRRRHGYPLMQKPRNILRAKLRKHCS